MAKRTTRLERLKGASLTIACSVLRTRTTFASALLPSMFVQVLDHLHRQVGPVTVEVAATVEGVTPGEIPIQLLRGAVRIS